jgi:hypothetical protein
MRCFVILATLAVAPGCELVASVDRDLIQEGGAGGGGAVMAPKGVLGGYTPAGDVFGWAMITNQDAPVQVRIEVNGTVAATLTASNARPDLATAGIHPTGNAGFKGAVTASSGDTIQAFIDSTDTELTGSPITVP